MRDGEAQGGEITVDGLRQEKERKNAYRRGGQKRD